MSPGGRRWDAVAASGERVARHTTALGLAVLAVVIVVSYLSVIAINGIPFQNPYHLRADVPADAPLLKDGDEVRVAGQRAGQVRKVQISPRGGARLSLELDDGPVGRDATATVRLRGLAGLTYVEITRGDVSRPLPDDALLPRARSRAGVELTDVIEGFDRDSRSALARTLSSYGTGLLGRGRDVNAALGDLPDLLSDGTPLLRAATPGRGDLQEMLVELRRTARGLATPRGRDLAGMVSAGNDVFATLARRREDLGATIDEVRPLADEARRTLPDADALLAAATPAARALSATARELQTALPEVNRLLAGRENLPALGRIAGTARPVVKSAEPLVVELRGPAGALAPLAIPLAPFSAHLARYRDDILRAPTGFTRWGKFTYRDGRAPGARAVRFAPVFTCARARNPYPAPGQALTEEQPCRG